MSISKQEIEAEALGAWLTFEGLVSKVDCQELAPSCDSKAKCLSVAVRSCRQRSLPSRCLHPAG